MAFGGSLVIRWFAGGTPAAAGFCCWCCWVVAAGLCCGVLMLGSHATAAAARRCAAAAAGFCWILLRGSDATAAAARCCYCLVPRPWPTLATRSGRPCSRGWAGRTASHSSSSATKRGSTYTPPACCAHVSTSRRPLNMHWAAAVCAVLSALRCNGEYFDCVGVRSGPCSLRRDGRDRDRSEPVITKSRNFFYTI